MDKLSYSAVIGTFERIEGTLEKILNIVPYCKEHENVWSDALITIILDSCSLLDSLWRYQSLQSPYVNKNHLKMKDYFIYFGEDMEKRWLVLWSENVQIISPYKNWSKTGQFKSDEDINELNWWTAYTELKHDRLSNRKLATLSNSVYAVGALLLAIIKCPDLRDEMDHAGWVTGNNQNPIAWLGEDSKATQWEYVAIETKLFGYPVGWCWQNILAEHYWFGPASSRFQDWFREYTQNVEK